MKQYIINEEQLNIVKQALAIGKFNISLQESSVLINTGNQLHKLPEYIESAKKEEKETVTKK